MLTENDKRIIERAKRLTNAEIAKLDSFARSHYRTGLFNAAKHCINRRRDILALFDRFQQR